MVQSEHLRHDTDIYNYIIDIQYRAAGKRPIGREMRHGKRRTAVAELRRYTGKCTKQRRSTEGAIFDEFWGVERGRGCSRAITNMYRYWLYRSPRLSGDVILFVAKKGQKGGNAHMAKISSLHTLTLSRKNGTAKSFSVHNSSINYTWLSSIGGRVVVTICLIMSCVAKGFGDLF